MACNESASGGAGPQRVQVMRRWPAVALWMGLLLGIVCHPQAAAGQTTGPDFSGVVTDQKGIPVTGALVEVNGQTTLSRTDGAFQLPVTTAETYILNISHPDFADASAISRTLLQGQTWPLVRAQIQTVDPRTTVTLKDTRPELKERGIGGAVFTLPPDALIDENGNPPAGLVRAAIATLDVANGEGPGDWAVRSDDGREEGYLVSYGAVYLLFTDSGGKVRYQLRTGVT